MPSWFYCNPPPFYCIPPGSTVSPPGSTVYHPCFYCTSLVLLYRPLVLLYPPLVLLYPPGSTVSPPGSTVSPSPLVLLYIYFWWILSKRENIIHTNITLPLYLTILSENSNQCSANQWRLMQRRELFTKIKMERLWRQKKFLRCVFNLLEFCKLYFKTFQCQKFKSYVYRQRVKIMFTAKE